MDRQAIRFGSSDPRVVLDAADAAEVSAALLRRYPVLAHDGLALQKIMLWRKEGAGWIYLALLENPDTPGDLCFTASFVSRGIEITPSLVTKYFAAGGAR